MSWINIHAFFGIQRRREKEREEGRKGDASSEMPSCWEESSLGRRRVGRDARGRRRFERYIF